MKIIEPDPRPELLCKFCGCPLAKEPQQRTLDGTEGWHIDCSLVTHNNSPITRAAVEAVVAELKVVQSTRWEAKLRGESRENLADHAYNLGAFDYLGKAIDKLRTLLDQETATDGS